MNKSYVMKTCPTDMCHASTILVTRKGTILSAWFGGSKEGNSDVGIWLARREKDCFEKPILMATSHEAHWNPVLFETKTRGIILFYKVGMQISRWRTMYRVSTNDGKTFGDEYELVTGDRGGRGPVRNKPIRLSSGRVLAPASLEQGEWCAFVDISDNDCMSFTRSDDIRIEALQTCCHEAMTQDSEIPVSEQSFEGRGVIQPTLWEDYQGAVHMLLRSTEGRIYRSDSTDEGMTWCSAYPTELPNNNSGIDLTVDLSGRLFLVCNPNEQNWGIRSPITLFSSKDNGQTWKIKAQLDEGEGEFSYPAVLYVHGRLYITYTYNRENIVLYEIDLQE